MDADPGEAIRIRNLADKTDTQIAAESETSVSHLSDRLARLGEQNSELAGERSDHLTVSRTRAGSHYRSASGASARTDHQAVARSGPGSTTVTDTHIVGYEPLLPPGALLDELPLESAHQLTVERTRAEVRAVLDGTDDRLLVVTGPCSVHDPKAALDYAARLAGLREHLADDLLIVMRVYFEKPRTVTGWSGLINDPGMDGSFDVHRGLRTARRLLLDIVGSGMPVGCEWLDPITPQYIADTVTWGAIGARTTESQVHRHLASGLSMPVGFKNGTDGDIQVAVDACRASAASHTFFGVTSAGAAAVVTTAGNPDTHVILRGGRGGPNYSSEHMAKALDLISATGLPRRIMVDASHGNSGKDHTRQLDVAKSLAGQVAGGQRGIVGVMLESFLVAGNQKPGDHATLTYGQSVTDACMDIEMTASALETLADAVWRRRIQLSS
jgi:3-deoxy-7-phosphoheptulonate synthase